MRAILLRVFALYVSVCAYKGVTLCYAATIQPNSAKAREARRADVPEILLDHLRSTTKPTAVVDDDVSIVEGFPAMRTATGVYLMMTSEALDTRSPFLPTNPIILEMTRPYAEYINVAPIFHLTADLSSLRIPLPRPVVDHTASQTPVRDQQTRPTCVAHAAVAAMEA